MTCTYRQLLPAVLALALCSAFAVTRVSAAGSAPRWDPKAAASYLDARAEWWTTWPNAARDHGTYCMSCHTTLPYAIARPELRHVLGERGPSPAEDKILRNLETRALQWRDM